MVDAQRWTNVGPTLELLAQRLARLVRLAFVGYVLTNVANVGNVPTEDLRSGRQETCGGLGRGALSVSLALKYCFRGSC